MSHQPAWAAPSPGAAPAPPRSPPETGHLHHPSPSPCHQCLGGGRGVHKGEEAVHISKALGRAVGRACRGATSRRGMHVNCWGAAGQNRQGVCGSPGLQLKQTSLRLKLRKSGTILKTATPGFNCKRAVLAFEVKTARVWQELAGRSGGGASVPPARGCRSRCSSWKAVRSWYMHLDCTIHSKAPAGTWEIAASLSA